MWQDQINYEIDYINARTIKYYARYFLSMNGLVLRWRKIWKKILRRESYHIPPKISHLEKFRRNWSTLRYRKASKLRIKQLGMELCTR